MDEEKPSPPLGHDRLSDFLPRFFDVPLLLFFFLFLLAGTLSTRLDLVVMNLLPSDFVVVVFFPAALAKAVKSSRLLLPPPLPAAAF